MRPDNWMQQLPEEQRRAVQQITQSAQRIKEEELRLWWLDRMTRSPHQLQEKMTLFWHGLLCSGIQEVKIGGMLIEQNRLFHKHATGNYKQLIAEIIHDPAMLKYLDADKNVVGKPNENLAREIMELFTMGEGQGYTEKDIAELARALTGMGVLGRDGAAAFRPHAAAVAGAAQAMRDVVTGPMPKGEVSTAVSARVPESLTYPCRACAARHISGTLFQLVGVLAGVALDRSRGDTWLTPAPGRAAVPTAASTEPTAPSPRPRRPPPSSGHRTPGTW